MLLTKNCTVMLEETNINILKDGVECDIMQYTAINQSELYWGNTLCLIAT